MRAAAEYQDLEVILERDLGRAPGPQTVAISGALAAVDAGAVDGSRAIVDDEPVTSFIGRAAEFRRLRQAWHATRAGNGELAIITGEAGIGKTRFCRHFLRWAVLQDARVLTGRCYSTERQLPYSGIVDALVGGLNSEDLAGLPPIWSAVVAELLPELRSQSASHEIRSLDGEGGRRRLFEGIARLLINAAERRTIVLFIDDFHWSDNSTIALVHYLARRLRAFSVFLLLAARSDEIEADSALDGFLSDATGLERHSIIAVSELDDTDTDLLIDSYERRMSECIPTRTRHWIRARVGGRPFLLIEMLKAWQDGQQMPSGDPMARLDVGERMFLPESVRTFLSRRLRGLSTAASGIVSGLAVLGKQAAPATVAKVSGLGASALVQGIAELERRGIIRERTDQMWFTHDLFRETAYQSLREVRRRILHGRAARVLESVAGTPVGTLAMHYSSAGDREMTYQCAMDAARQSETIFALAEAEFFLRMAATNALGPEQAITAREALAKFLYRNDRFIEAESHFDALEEHYSASGDVSGQLLAGVNGVVALFVRRVLPLDELANRLGRLMAAAEDSGHVEQTWIILKHLLNIGHETGNRKIVNSMRLRALEVAGRLKDPAERIRARANAATMLGMYRSAREGLRHAHDVVRCAKAVEDPYVLSAALSSRAKILMLAGLLHEAEQDLKLALQVAERIVYEGQVQRLRVTLIAVLNERGDYSQAEAVFDDVLSAAENAGTVHDVAYAYGNLVTAYFEQQRIDGAVSIARRMLSYAASNSPWWYHVYARSILGLCAIARGDLDEARRHRHEVLAAYKGPEFFGDDISYIELFLARLAAEEGDTETALARLERGIAAFEDRDVFCRSRMQLERARLLVARDPREAWRQAGEVRRLGVEAGARPLVEKADAILDVLPTF